MAFPLWLCRTKCIFFLLKLVKMNETWFCNFDFEHGDKDNIPISNIVWGQHHWFIKTVCVREGTTEHIWIRVARTLKSVSHTRWYILFYLCEIQLVVFVIFEGTSFFSSIFYPACHHILSGSLNEPVPFTHNRGSVPEGYGTAGFQTSRKGWASVM